MFINRIDRKVDEVDYVNDVNTRTRLGLQLTVEKAIVDGTVIRTRRRLSISPTAGPFLRSFYQHVDVIGASILLALILRSVK